MQIYFRHYLCGSANAEFTVMFSNYGGADKVSR
jgi:hypothetical protein